MSTVIARNIAELSLSQMAAVFNAVSEKPVKKFSSKDEGVRRTEAALEARGAFLLNFHDDGSPELALRDAPEQPTLDQPEPPVDTQPLPPTPTEASGEKPPVAEEPEAPAEATPFVKLTREELQALSDSDPVARAKYRADRRAAARQARKVLAAK